VAKTTAREKRTFMIVTYGIIFLIALGVGYMLLKPLNKQKIPVVLIILSISSSVLIYFYIGNPDYADQPYNTVQEQEQALQKLSTTELIARYEARLKQKDSPAARIVLANALVRLGHLEQAEQHFKAAYILDKEQTPDIMISYAEIIVKLNKNHINTHAKTLIDASLKRDAKNPRGLFYQGLFFAQNNDIPQAVTVWKNLVTESADKPYANIIAENLHSVITQYKITPDMIGLQDNQTITKDNLAMIEKMVQSLEDKVRQNPDDKALKTRLDDVHLKFEMLKQKFNR
jgi:lipopolysaccharide biosynthesis regulator YciM